MEQIVSKKPKDKHNITQQKIHKSNVTNNETIKKGAPYRSFSFEIVELSFPTRGKVAALPCHRGLYHSAEKETSKQKNTRCKSSAWNPVTTLARHREIQNDTRGVSVRNTKNNIKKRSVRPGLDLGKTGGTQGIGFCVMRL